MVLTNKQKFNKKYGFSKDAPHSRKEISKLSGVSMNILNKVADRAGGAYANNFSSVRNIRGVKGGSGPKMSINQWKTARIYSFVMGGITQKTTDKDLWKKHLNSKKK